MFESSNKYGKSGVIIGFCAFGFVLFQFWFGSFGVDIAGFDIDDIISSGSLVLAFICLVFAATSFLRNENKRFSAVAATLGSITLAFHFMLVAIGLVIILIIVFYILSNN